MRYVLPAALVVALASAAAALAVVVSPANTRGWSVSSSSCATPTTPLTGTQGFVFGPGNPPGSGVGSYQLAIGADSNTYRSVERNFPSGTLLSSLSALRYWTYISHRGSSDQNVYIDLSVDWNGNGTEDDILTFEPIYQTGGYSGDAVPNQGAVASGVWQDWHARNGGWWSDQAGTSGPPLVTLNHYSSLHPGAQLLSIRLAAGCGGGTTWTNFDGNFDQVTIGLNGNDRTYNFEPRPTSPPPPKDKVKLCHNGHTISVGASAVAAHLAHGDRLGACDRDDRSDDKSKDKKGKGKKGKDNKSKDDRS